ncbi:MAG: thermonuclease family protein [Bacillota bacterium]
MKKILLLSLTIVSLFLVAACGDEDSDDNDDTDPSVLTTIRTDELELTADYEGKSFISDGIGEVELSACVDGDTARFTEDGNSSFSVRFLGVDTPESTAAIEEWGKAASDFTCEKLTNAETIVLEWDENADERKTNDRYLAFVWYDGRLLNLELIEMAFSASSAANLKYGETMQNAWYAVQGSGRHIYGEIDPDYDYSIDGSEITIEELTTNRELYVGRRVIIEGTITELRSDEFVLTQDGHSITVYFGYGLTGSNIAVGNTVRISDLVPTYFPAHLTSLSALQLSDFDRQNVTLIEESTETE